MSSMRNTPRSPHRLALYASAIAAYETKATDSPVDTPKFADILDTLVEVAAASNDCDQEALSSLEILSAGMRSVVVRCAFASDSAEGIQDSPLISKHYRRKDSATNSGGFGYVREVCALAVFDHFSPGLFCSLLGSDALERVTVTEDLGQFSTVHSLLKSGQVAQGLEAYLRFFSAIYQQDKKWHLDFKARIRTLDVQASSPGSLTSPRLAIKGWRRLATIAGVQLPEPLEYLLEINTVPGFSLHTVLSHGDFSPHNLAVTGEGVRAFDAEGAAIHHAFLPVADMMLGFPLSPFHTDYLPLLETPLWQDACKRLYACASHQDTMADFDTDIHLTEQILMLTGMVLELNGFVAGAISPTYRALFARTAERASEHYPSASRLIQQVLEHKSL